MTLPDVLYVLAALGAGFGAGFLYPELRYRLWRLTSRRRRVEQLGGASVDGERASFDAPLKNIALEPLRGPRFYVSDVAMSDFRCFDRATVELRYPGEDPSLNYDNVNLILGDNGSGKSTVLRAIAITALGPVL